eukprot:Protomagalhaensia_sp_Gyna_25__203@NODE_1097_length_2194_cov_64_613457_g867_i0_p2_GENE_NODE_1097_length_2194_cov_64_613457_g867_i0NODE_1097_length_2194_cov_64_613457_g867_i0_p2_ORF_typecomplete_len133_score2_99_NODE_1097_length_2194_cov_64_613457_g867_i0505903
MQHEGYSYSALSVSRRMLCFLFVTNGNRLARFHQGSSADHETGVSLIQKYSIPPSYSSRLVIAEISSRLVSAESFIRKLQNAFGVTLTKQVRIKAPARSNLSSRRMSTTTSPSFTLRLSSKSNPKKRLMHVF